MIYELLIPRALTSANARIVNSGATRWAYAKARDKWADDIRTAMLKQRIPEATGRRRVTLTRLMGKGQKVWDGDNLQGGAKYVRDAMQPSRRVKTKNGAVLVRGAGLIVSDGAKDAEFVYEQERAADGKPATRITVEDLDGP